MTPVALLRRLGPFDARNLRRDAFLAWAPLMPLVMALAYRVGIPPLRRFLEAAWSLDLTPYEPLLMSLLLVLTPTLAGVVVGFLLLDERDEGTLLALRVTPVSLGSYLLYRLSLPVLLGFLLTLAAYPLAGLLPLAWWQLLSVSFLAALTAPLMALLLAAIASDTVSGFALLKLLNAVNLLPVVAFFLPPLPQFAIAVLPTYWPLKAYWLAAAGQPFLLPLVFGAAYNLAVIWPLMRWFERRR